MRRLFICLFLIICFESYSQNQTSIENISLVQISPDEMELRLPFKYLDTGDFNIKKRISVYKGFILTSTNEDGSIKVLNEPAYKIQGFCAKGEPGSIDRIQLNITDREYLLEVSYIYPDGRITSETASLVIQ